MEHAFADQGGPQLAGLGRRAAAARL